MTDKKKILNYCKECLMPHTRPRQTFNNEGVCGACEWNREKKNTINWDQIWEER